MKYGHLIQSKAMVKSCVLTTYWNIPGNQYLKRKVSSKSTHILFWTKQVSTPYASLQLQYEYLPTLHTGSKKSSLQKIGLMFSCFRWLAVLSHLARKSTGGVHCLLVFTLLNWSQRTAFLFFPAHFPSSQKTFYCALTEGQWLSLLYSSTMVNWNKNP